MDFSLANTSFTHQYNDCMLPFHGIELRDNAELYDWVQKSTMPFQLRYAKIHGPKISHVECAPLAKVNKPWTPKREIVVPRWIPHALYIPQPGKSYKNAASLSSHEHISLRESRADFASICDTFANSYKDEASYYEEDKWVVRRNLASYYSTVGPMFPYLAELTPQGGRNDSCKNRCQRALLARERAKSKSYALHLLSQLKQDRARLNRAAGVRIPHIQNLEPQAGFLSELGNLPGNINEAAVAMKEMLNSCTTIFDQIRAQFNFPANFSLFRFSLGLASLFNNALAGRKIGILLDVIVLCNELDLTPTKITEFVTRLIERTGLTTQGQSTKDNLQVFAGVVLSLVSMAARGTDLNYGSTMRSLADFGRASVGFTHVKDLVMWFYDFIMNQYNLYVLGKTTEELDWEKAYPGLQAIFEQCELFKTAAFRMEYLDRSVELCQIVCTMYNNLEEFKHSAFRAKDVKMTALLGSYLHSLNAIHLAALHSPAHSHQHRICPHSLWMYGASGTGKSNLVTFLKSAIFVKYYQGKGDWTPDNIAMTRVAENEFFDGYFGQPIINYDDILQQTDSTSKPNPEVMEIIRMHNETPFHLHMANVADKKNVYFKSEHILATTNIMYPVPKSIASPLAFQRRWNMAINVKVAPAFADANGKLDPRVVATHVAAHGQGFVKAIYAIDIYDIITKSVIVSDLTLDQFLTRFFASVDAAKTKTESLATSIQNQTGVTNNVCGQEFNNFMDSLRPQIDDSEEEFVDAVPPPYVQCPPTYEEVTRERIGELFVLLEDQRMNTEIAQTTTRDLCLPEGDNINMFDILNAEDYVEREDHTSPAAIVAAAILQSIERARNQMTRVTTHMKRFFGTLVQLTLTTTQTLFSWFVKVLKKIITSPIAIYGFMVLGICVGRGLFSRCPFRSVSSFESLCNTLPCEKCFICDSLDLEKLAIGTEGYGVSVIEQLQSSSIADDVLPFRAMSQWYSEHIKTVCVDTYLETVHERNIRNDTIIAVQGLRPESREVNTRLPTPKYRAESREVNTKNPRPNYRAESREVNTLSPRNRMRTEMSVPIVTTQGGTTSRAASVDPNVWEQWESIAQRNMVRVSTGTGGECMNAVFITGRTLMLPYHFVDAAKNQGNVIKVRNPHQTQACVYDLDACMITQCHDLFGNNLDLAFISIDGIASRKNIVAKFATANEHDKLQDGTFVFSGLRSVRGLTTLNCVMYDKVTRLPSLSYSNANGTYMINSGFKYDCSTRAGDCGALLFAKNNLLSGKILGVHTAGDGKAGVGVAIATSREFITRNLNEHIVTHDLSGRYIVDGRSPFEMTNLEPEMFSPEMFSITSNVMPEMFSTVSPVLDERPPTSSLTEHGDCISLGTLTQPRQPIKTKLNPSLIYESVSESTTRPALLRPTLIGGLLVDPMIKGIKKILNVTEPLNRDILAICVNDVAEVLESSGSRQVLSFKEAITGVEGEEFMAPLNRKSSPGYPWSLEANVSGKRKYFGYDEYEFDSGVEADVNHLLGLAAKQIRGDVVYTSTLKDERRTHAKVDEGKTRVFAAAPMNYTIAVRQYFLAFVADVMTNRIDNEIGVGTNVYSLDWHNTGKMLTVKGKHVIAGDFSNFDGSLRQDILWKILDIINNWYDDGEHNQRVRETLFEEICNARVIVKGELIQQTHSQPSGNPLTVVINSIFNQIVMRYAYMYLKIEALGSSKCDFREMVSMQTYGDDNVLNIADTVIEWYNQISITRALATIGLTYTDEAKSGTLKLSRTLDGIRYLKREFVVDTNGYFHGPLDLSVILEMTNWIRGNQYCKATTENIETAMTELVLHGREQYEKYAKEFKKQSLIAGLKVNIPSYIEASDVIHSNYFGVSAIVL